MIGSSAGHSLLLLPTARCLSLLTLWSLDAAGDFSAGMKPAIPWPGAILLHRSMDFIFYGL